MIPVGPVTTLNRSILLTERRMSDTGGDDFICGHCGHVMLEGFDPSTVSGNPVYQCGVCENNNDLPFAPVMIAIGLLGDEADRYQLATTRWNPTPSATGVSVQMQAKLRQGNAGVLVGDPRARKSAQIYQYRR